MSILPSEKINLHTAISGEDVARLCAEGADPNARNAQGQSPLHTAHGPAVAEVMQALICAGAQVTVTDPEERTPLHYVADMGAAEAAPGECEVCIDILMKAGANPFARDHQGNPPSLTAIDAIRIERLLDNRDGVCPVVPTRHPTRLGEILDMRSPTPPPMSPEARSHKRSR